VSRARAGLLALALLPVLALPAAFAAVPASAQDAGERAALVVRVEGVSFEELLSIPEVRALARAGGAGLLANAGDVATVPGAPGSRERTLELDPLAPGGLETVGEGLREAVLVSPVEELLVIVLGGEASPEMQARKDELVGIAIGSGHPSELFAEVGGAGSLTSGSTRRPGVVTGGDVRATLDAFLGGRSLFAGELAPGEPIEAIEGPPPIELHERYLAQRRMYVPIGSAAALYAGVAGLLAIVCLALGASAPGRLRRFAGWAVLSIPALATGLLAAGHLPELTYATVVPFVCIVTALGTMAFAPLARRSPLLVPAGIGVAVLAYFLFEALLGWTAALTPFLGGSHLDGVRFYGLPNVFIGLLIGASMYVAQRLRVSNGVASIAAVALLAGLPYLGSNLGGGVSLFAAAGLWLAVRERERLGRWRSVGVSVGLTVLGGGAILIAHAISPFETHVSRSGGTARGVAGVWDTFVDRLQVGFDLIAQSPAALIPVVGLPVALLVALRPPAPIRSTFERWPTWRDAIVVTLFAGIVAYVANDSGPAAAGLAFGLGLGGLLGVPLLSGAGKMGS